MLEAGRHQGCTGLFTLSLTAVPSAPYAARYKTAVILREWQVPPELADSAVLLTSELVTNAIRFGQRPGNTPLIPSEIGLAIWREPGRLVVEVSDQNPAARPVLLPECAGSESGRGLRLAADLSSEWWYYLPRAGWKTVACVITSGGPEGDAADDAGS